MSVTSLDETIIIKNFREIRKDPSKKLEYYLNIQEILKFFLDVSVCYGEQSKVISSPFQHINMSQISVTCVHF